MKSVETDKVVLKPDYAPRIEHHRIQVVDTEARRAVICRVARGIALKGGNQLPTMIPLIEDLKGAGVPVLGSLSICGVSSGVLEMYSDGDDLVITWKDQ